MFTSGRFTARNCFLSVLLGSDKAMQKPPQPDVRTVIKNAVKLPDTLRGWIGLVCLIIFIVLLGYFTP